MSLQNFKQSLCSAALAIAAAGGATFAMAQSGGFVGADEPATGRIVPISPGGGAEVVLEDATDDAATADSAPAELSKHWIGILLGRVSNEMRAQLDLPEDQGVLVRRVVTDSPADQAGIKQFDIVLNANDKPVVTGLDLMELVQQEGEHGGKLTLDVLRRGEHQKIDLTPAPRPAEENVDASRGQGWGSGGAMSGMPGMPNFGPGSPHLRMRVPSSAFAQGFNLGQMPSDISVNIQRQNDGPAHITVKRGNDTWEIVGDDPKSLEQLPDDVRPFVERMLAGGGSPLFQMPGMNRRRGVDAMPGMWGPSAFDNDAMQQQLHRMEQQLQQMRLQLEQDIQMQRQPTVPKDPNEAQESLENDAN
jgi:hypothetical protein